MRETRRGISLLEVLIATGMLFGSLAVLSQLAHVGRLHLERAEASATAARLCQAQANDRDQQRQPGSISRVAHETGIGDLCQLCKEGGGSAGVGELDLDGLDPQGPQRRGQLPDALGVGPVLGPLGKPVGIVRDGLLERRVLCWSRNFSANSD